MTWRDDVGEGAYEPVRAGWEVLDSARAIAFTGEIEFELLPAARVYLDRGRIYYAARNDDPDVADRLVAMGVVRPDDLARGVMVSDDVDHLGRLFDRVPTLDRERVMLALEQITEGTTAWVARQSVGTPQTRPYTFHPSGVHQWYITPPAPRPAVTFPAPGPGERVRRSSGVPRATTPTEPVPPAPAAPPAAEAPGVRTPEPAPAPEPEARVSSTAGRDLVDFELRWPSGEVETPSAVVPADPAPVATDGLERFDHRVEPPIPPTDAVPVPDDDPETREMTIAVRRAMAAVTAGTARGRPVSSVVPVLDDAPDPFDRWSEVDRRHTPSVDHDPFDHPAAPERTVSGSPLAPPMPSDRGAVDERRGALQRLIDGLRGS